MKPNPTPTTIAQALKHRYPDIYRELELDCSTPIFTQENIDNIWSVCELDPDRTKVVIAVALLMYSPQTMNIGIKARKGLMSAIARCRGSTQPATSMHVPVAVEWYKIYPLFRDKVDQVVKELKKQKI